MTNHTKNGEIKVQILYKQEPLSCEQALVLDSMDWDVQQLAFFVSALSISQNGIEQALPLGTNEWQTDGVALLQWTDCSRPLGNDEQASMVFLPAYNASLKFSQPQDFSEVSHLSFTLGIPFELNHLNPLSQKSPLNIPSMFWSWRAGHKFFRLDMQAQRQSWVFHLGSIGCVADSAMRSPQLGCVQHNRVKFNLPKQQQGELLVLHLDRLLAGVELTSQNACLMQLEQASCYALMTNLQDHEVFEWR